jgi:CMP/dCMP kinase
MTLEQFGAYCEAHPEVDRALDAYQAELLKGDPILLEGRLSGYLAYRDRMPAYKVWFTCDAYVRGRRLVDREGGELESRMAEMRRREESERKRYLAYYGYDINDLSVYDLVLDTSELSKERVVEAVVRGYDAFRKPRKWWKLGMK